ncbi:uncharacterized protein [Procambarus clarkii]|uniref:uncharacterized protein isoform X2 n=1 Tax=Procambarus clarkii TaxID=6728 RepID=UPI003743B6D3
MSSGDEEEIAEEIPEYNEDDASLTDSKGESFIFPVVGLQADETSIAGILLNQDERTTVDEHACIQIAETLSLSPEAKSLLNEPLHFTSNGDDPKIISPETLTKKNENGQKEKEVEGEAMAPKSYKSLSQHDDTLLKHQTTKSCSKRDHTNSPDELTVSSDWSVESFSSHSTGNYSEYIKDRSVSEVAVSVPKLTVISLDSACKVSSLVKQFSLQNEDLNDKTTDTGPRRQSLPVDLSQATYLEANSFMSLLHDKQSSLRFDESSCSYTSKECVSSKIGYFNRQDKEEHLCDKGPRESPKKLGHLSPRVKASLEKIGTCLSRGSSIDSHIDLEERQILKSKENLTFKEASKNIPKILLASQKENTPCHKTKLKKMLQKINKEKLVSLGKMEELGDVNVSLSECSTCISSLVNSKHTIPNENKCTAQESSHPEITKVAAEDVCDTEEEVEDMPVEMEQNIARYSKVENEDICVNENQFSLVNSSQSSNEHCSLEPSKSSRISRVSDGEAGVDSFHNNFSEATKKKISCILDINTDEDREVVCKKSFKFFSDENLCQSTDSNIQAAASSQLDTSDGRLSNTAAKAGDGPKVDTNCGAQSNKLKERNISEASECPSQDDFPMSLENESCDELINLEIDHSGDEVFGDDFSDASEFVIELVSKSPISAITERTEESGQENENLNSRLERVSDLCSENSNESLKQTVDNSNPGNTCQSIEQKMVNESAIIPTSEKHFPSLPLSVVNDSSHFTGTSSVLEDSLVQTQTSLLARNESVDPHSSQCFASVVGQYSSKPGTKAKLPILNNNLKEDKIEKSATPPSSPTIKTLYGPVRTTLHRNSSRSMHNLASSHGSAYKSQGLHNRALSLSNDNLESNSLRAKSLSPGPVPRQKLKCSPESERRGNLNRRCISAVALNENEGQVNLKRNRSFSLNKLNRSRSSSLTSISSSKKLDYSQVPSKVRQYIKEMKDKDIRNSTRSLPSTPARKKKQQATSQIVVLDEKLLRELSQYDDDDEMPDDIRKIRDQIIGEKGDSKRLEDILKLLILERKSRHASDTTLAALQLRFDNLNALFAEKQNEIDRLRFYKDIQVNKEYIFSIQTQEERIITSDRSSHNTTAPNTPNKSAHHYLISPNMTRRSSYQTTPPNTPNIRSLSPTLSHYNIIKTTSTPIADPNWSFAYDPNSSYMFQEKHAGGVSRVQCSTVSGEDRSRDIKNQERNRNPENQEKSRDLKDQAMSKDLKTTESSHDAVSLELWMKDARTVLKRIREFALLEGSAALQHSEKSIIWNSILQQVKLWQASLVDPEVPHAAYESSNISPAPSILSLNSSQSFDPHVDPSNSLTKIHVDSTQSPNKSGTNLLLDHATKGNSRSVRSKIINYSPQDHSIDCNSPLLRSPDRLDFDLPKCSWRSSSATPRLPWGRTIKVRDLDSGCPGSEQSTRMSHNASLEQPEQLEMPHFHSSLDATSNVKVSSTILVEPNQFREHDNEEREEDYAYECENANKVVSRSSSHSHDHDNTSRGTAEASPPSDVVKMAFPESEKCEIENVSCTDIDRKSRALSASRSSINSSKKRIDQHYSHSESQDAIQKHRHGRPISADLVGTNGSNYYRREKSRNSDSKENTLHEGDVRSRDRDFISDVPYAHQRMKPRKLMEKKMLVGKERSKSFQNDLKMSAFAGKEQSNKSNLMSTMDKDIFKQSNTKKYSTKYVSGNSSDYSDTSSCSQNSSNIYNNITKLKRDLNIIKSQMMNLTSEVFQKKRSKGEGVHSGSNNQSSRLQKRRKPIKALDMSVYSEESERDSSITSLDPYVHQTLEDQKPWSSKHRATTPAKIKSRNGTKEEFHKQPRSPPLDWNVKDSWQDKSTSFPNSSLEMLSESMFTAAKIEKLPRSTPKNKKCHSDRSRKLSPCPVNSRAVNETEDKKCGECVKRNLFLEDNVKATNVQEYLTDQNQSSKRLLSVHNSTKHVSIQTEKSNNKIIHIPELAETAALTTGTSNEVSTDGTHIKHQGKQPTQTTDGQFLNTTAPVIYIQNYNCRNETSQAGSDAVENLKSPQRSSDRCKHRRSGSAQELLVSLDEATTLAERLRSRTESMLSYLNLHFTVHVDQIQS